MNSGEGDREWKEKSEMQWRMGKMGKGKELSN